MKKGVILLNQASVLIVDDDIKLANLLEKYFLDERFLPFLAHDGETALKLTQEKRPDIIILDLMLPGMDGWEVCKEIRKEDDTPIIMLTSRDEERDKLMGLEIGADDYVTKPFSPREVVARAKVILRRAQKGLYNSETLEAGPFFMDLASHEISKAGKTLDITATEFKILKLLLANPGRVFSRLQIVEQTQGYAFEGYERTIDAHIKNLRRKIEDNTKEPKYIQTVYGVGYKFVGVIHE